jgi:hypothetical protein
MDMYATQIDPGCLVRIPVRWVYGTWLDQVAENSLTVQGQVYPVVPQEKMDGDINKLAINPWIS